MSTIEDPYTSIADLFLLEQWQEDSPLSPEAQREQIFAEFMTLGVDGQQPYKDQLRRRGRRSNLTPEERGILDCVRQPAVPERILQWTPWLRMCYEPSTDAAFSRIVERLENQFMGQAIILNDPALYNFGADWHKIFLRFPELLVYPGSAEYYHERRQEALREESDLDEEGEDNIRYEDEDDYLYYYWALVAGRIHIVDKTTLASEGRNAGKVCIVWYDACGRLLRSYRDEVFEAADITAVDNPLLDEDACWVNGTVGKDFKWGAPLGPPYNKESENEGADSEGSPDADE